MDAISKEQLQQAYRFIKSGKKREARGLLAPIVKIERDNEQAWFLLALAVNDRDHQILALKQVLRINPQNVKARSRLDQLEADQAESGGPSLEVHPKPFDDQSDSPHGAEIDDPLTRLEKLTNSSKPFVTPTANHRSLGTELPFSPPASSKLMPKATPPFSDDAPEDLSADDLVQSFRQSRQPHDIQEEPLKQEEPIYQGKPYFYDAPLFEDDPPSEENLKTAASSRKKRLINGQSFAFLLVCIFSVLLVWFGYQQREQVRVAIIDTLSYFGIDWPTRTNDILLPYPGPGDAGLSGETKQPIPTRKPADPPYGVSDSLSFIMQACPFSVPDGMNIECGFIVVPQNRRSGDTHNTIQLFAAVIESSNPSPTVEPLLFAIGNPGEPVVKNFLNSYKDLIQILTQQQDLVIFDPRGVGLSRPRLNCPELWIPTLQQRTGGTPVDVLEIEIKTAFEKCGDRLRREGVDLASYNAAEGAADIHDIVLALGYVQVDLYGSAYGSQVALAAARAYPDLFNALILESPIPENANLLGTEAQRAGTLLKALFDDCSGIPACNEAFPDLEGVFNEVSQHFNETPLNYQYKALDGTLIELPLNDVGIVNSLLWGMRYADIIPILPKSIYDLRNGNLEYLDYVTTNSNSLTAEFNLGASFASLCNDQAFTATQTGFDEGMDGLPELPRLGTAASVGGIEKFASLCEVLGARPGPKITTAQGWFELPVLILMGAYDPLSSLLYAEQLAANLPNSYRFDFPYQGYSMLQKGNPCSQDILQQFINDPGQRPSADCQSMPSNELPFIVPSSNTEAVEMAPVSDLRNHLTGIQPAIWAADGKGYYRRMSYPLDPTQVAMLSSMASPEEWETSLSTQFLDKGFDAPPTQISTRNANDLNWLLYSTSSAGYPVYLAFTETGDRTFLVIMICEPGELRYLSEAVFQPMMDALLPIP